MQAFFDTQVPTSPFTHQDCQQRLVSPYRRTISRSNYRAIAVICVNGTGWNWVFRCQNRATGFSLSERTQTSALTLRLLTDCESPYPSADSILRINILFCTTVGFSWKEFCISSDRSRREQPRAQWKCRRT